MTRDNNDKDERECSAKDWICCIVVSLLIGMILLGGDKCQDKLISCAITGSSFIIAILMCVFLVSYYNETTSEVEPV